MEFSLRKVFKKTTNKILKFDRKKFQEVNQEIELFSEIRTRNQYLIDYSEENHRVEGFLRDLTRKHSVQEPYPPSLCLEEEI